MPIPACLNVSARSDSQAKSAGNVPLVFTLFPHVITASVPHQVHKWIMVSIWPVMLLEGSVRANLSTQELPVISVLMDFS